jgi:hypothetical protein
VAESKGVPGAIAFMEPESSSSNMILALVVLATKSGVWAGVVIPACEGRYATIVIVQKRTIVSSLWCRVIMSVA